jgi:hypothetical protein
MRANKRAMTILHAFEQIDKESYSLTKMSLAHAENNSKSLKVKKNYKMLILSLKFNQFCETIE